MLVPRHKIHILAWSTIGVDSGDTGVSHQSDEDFGAKLASCASQQYDLLLPNTVVSFRSFVLSKSGTRRALAGSKISADVFSGSSSPTEYLEMRS
jgi:hypothetical protein